MTDNEILVSVIIPVYNDAARLKLCLEALRQQTLPSSLYEIIVVDNASTDNVADVTDQFPQVKLLTESRPGSYAARNLGIAQAAGEIIAFTDADCLPLASWLERGVWEFHKTENCGVLGGRIEMFCRDEQNPTTVETTEKLTYLRQRQYVRELNFAATANMFVAKKVFAAVGLFRSDLKSSGDLEFGNRAASDSCYRIVYSDAPTVRHPARHTLKEYCRREKRIAGSHLVLSRARGENFIIHIFDRKQGLLPPLKNFLTVWRTAGRHLSLTKRIGVSIVLAIGYLTKWGENLKLLFGGQELR